MQTFSILVLAGLSQLATANPGNSLFPRGCNGNNSQRALTGTQAGISRVTSRTQDCNSYFATTITPPTITSTVYVYTSSTSAGSCTISTASNIPGWAISACGTPVAQSFSSACLCAGVTASTTILPFPSQHEMDCQKENQIQIWISTSTYKITSQEIDAFNTTRLEARKYPKEMYLSLADVHNEQSQLKTRILRPGFPLSKGRDRGRLFRLRAWQPLPPPDYKAPKENLPGGGPRRKGPKEINAPKSHPKKQTHRKTTNKKQGHQNAGHA
ncbi:hypothetical protein G7Y89_g4621 [Cudoniella acicularis]|uniref:Uncharacterized protein n=1 Tax=Cudoniella acicularis TaxID=354080 RepID=A0A8H4RR42_9HELO|nr:hypothetical protein G7Y89_g4621 [Cudoniella acicularis]